MNKCPKFPNSPKLASDNTPQLPTFEQNTSDGTQCPSSMVSPEQEGEVSEYAIAQEALEEHCNLRGGKEEAIKAAPSPVDEVVAMPTMPVDEFDRELEDEARLLEVALEQLYNCTQHLVEGGKKNP